MNVKALGYVMIEAKNLEQWRAFLTNVIGMMVVSTTDNNDSLSFKMDEYPWRIKVFKGAVDRFAIAGWEVEDETDFNQAIKILEANDIAYEFGSQKACNDRCVKNFIRFKDPANGQIEIFYAMRLDYTRLASPVGLNAFVTGYHGDMGLGHYVIPTKNFSETLHFYTNILGFGKTDYMHFHFSNNEGGSGQGLYFLHVDNPRHHSLAIFEEPKPSETACVHLMFEVPNIDEVGYFIDRCKHYDIPIISSLGRHTNDQMMSVYVQSPAGFAIEYGCDGVQLNWQTYKATESEKPSLWGHDWNVST